MATKEEKDLKAVLSDLGFVFELLKALVHAILKKGGTIKHLRRIINESDLALKIADLLVDKVVATFSALVTYVPPSIAELNSAFDWVDDFYARAIFEPISRCFGVWTARSREVVFEYFHMDRDVSTGEVLAEMDRQGLRPAVYEELLAFGAKYPDEQRIFPIVALGSVCHRSSGGPGCAYLYRNGSLRSLCLGRTDFDWYSVYRFLAVRK